MSKLLEGKFALILGIANKWSLAYAIAQAFSREGATLVLTYLGERQKESIEELSKDLNVAAILPCDVTKDDDLAALHAIASGAEPAAARGGAQPGVRQSRRSDAALSRDQPGRLSAGAGCERLFAGGGGARGGAGDDRRRLAEHPNLPGLDARGDRTTT